MEDSPPPPAEPQPPQESAAADDIAPESAPVEPEPAPFAARGGIGEPSLPPRLPPLSNLLEKFLLENLTPLIVICAALMLEFGNQALVYSQHGRAALRPPDRTAKEKPKRPPLELENLKLINPVVLGYSLLLLGGAVVCLAGGFICLAVPETRARFKQWISESTVRPLPELRLMDFAAIFAVWFATVRVLALNLALGLDLESSDGRAVALVLNGAGFLAAAVAAIYLARRRAGGKHGSAGICPFWTLSPSVPPRSVWRDIGLGISTYVLSLWVISLAIVANQFLVKALGGEPDQHVLMDELAKPQSAAVLAVFFIMATVGAAVFEEILFRGVLYNVFRHYLSGSVSAFLAAMIFAAVHMIESHILGLFVMALILTWLYDRTGRLVASMTFHCVNNLVSLIVALYVQRPGG